MQDGIVVVDVVSQLVDYWYYCFWQQLEGERENLFDEWSSGSLNVYTFGFEIKIDRSMMEYVRERERKFDNTSQSKEEKKNEDIMAFMLEKEWCAHQTLASMFSFNVRKRNILVIERFH